MRSRPATSIPVSKVWSEGREPAAEIIHTCGLEECVAQGAAAIWLGSDEIQLKSDWHVVPGQPHLRRGHRRGAGDAGHGHPQPGHGRGQHQDERRRQSFNLLVGRHRPRHRLGHGADPDGRRGAGLPAGGFHHLLVRHRFHALRQGRVRVAARPTFPGGGGRSPRRRSPSRCARSRPAC